MAQIDRFDAKAPRGGLISVSPDTGQAQAWTAFAQAAGSITAQLTDMAAKKTVAENIENATRIGVGVQMPGVQFAFDQPQQMTAAAPAGGASGRPMRPAAGTGPVRKIISDAALKYGIDPNALIRIAQIESSLNPNAKNPSSSAGGLFQFIDSTASQYGLANRYDPAQAADAAARLARDNAAHLRKVLGREPSAGELYLAHQQGAGGAALLLGNPGADAASIVGADAVRLNGGKAGMTAGDFANLWISKAGGASSGLSPFPAGTPQAATVTEGGGVRVTLTGQFGGVPQVPGGTLGGDAFNRAALDITLNRLDTAMRAQMEGLALQHRDDPAALAGALDAMRAGYMADLPPAAVARVDGVFERTRYGLMREAASRYEADLKDRTLASFEDALDSRLTNAARIAANAGTDPQADSHLVSELALINADIDAAPLSEATKARMKRDAEQQVLAARVTGGFDAIGAPQARADYVRAFQEQWKGGAGYGGRMSAETYEKVNGALTRGLQTDQAAAAKRSKEIDQSIGDQIDYLKKGWPVPPAVRARLKSAVLATGDEALAAEFDFLDQLAAWQGAHITAPLPVIDAQISAMRGRMREEGPTERAMVTLDVMEGLRSEMARGLKEDPLTFATRAGVAEVKPLVFDTSETMAASLNARVADAQAVAQHYGIAPRYFTPGETDALKKLINEQPLVLPSMVSGLVSGLGRAAPAALSEISKDAPVLAHLGGLLATTGSQRLAVEVAEGLELRGRDGFKSALPSAAKLKAAMGETAGSAFMAAPGLQEAAFQTAGVLMERRIAALGMSTDDFDQPGAPAREAWLSAVDEVLGARTFDGVKHGGLTEVNGAMTIAPPDMPADDLSDRFRSLTDADLARLPATGSANGVPVTAAQIRRGVLVAVGNGTYRVALGDPMSPDPRYVMGAGGGYWTFDAHALPYPAGYEGPVAP